MITLGEIEESPYKGRNTEKRRQYLREYYWKNREKILKRNRENENKKVASRKYREENKEYTSQYQKEWQKNNPEKVRYYYKIGNHRRRAILKNKELGNHSKEEWEELKKKYNHTCQICGKKEPFDNQVYRFLTEDHIIPLSKGGMNTIENIQPLCLSCNSRKSNGI